MERGEPATGSQIPQRQTEEEMVDALLAAVFAAAPDNRNAVGLPEVASALTGLNLDEVLPRLLTQLVGQTDIPAE